MRNLDRVIGEGERGGDKVRTVVTSDGIRGLRDEVTGGVRLDVCMQGEM